MAGQSVQRYYDPAIGRFLSVDPVAASPVNGQNFNGYWYANNNPYRFTDPGGRLAEDEKEKQPVTGSNIPGSKVAGGMISNSPMSGGGATPPPSSGSGMTAGSNASQSTATDSGSGERGSDRGNEEASARLGCVANDTCIPLDQLPRGWRGDKQFMKLVAAGPTAVALVMSRGAGAQYLVSTPRGRAMLFAACQAIHSCQGGRMEVRWVRQQRRANEALVEQSRKDGLIEAQRINTELVQS